MTTRDARRSSVLLVANHHRARYLQRKYPDRWDHIVTPINGLQVLLGLPITSLTVAGLGYYNEDWSSLVEAAQVCMIAQSGTGDFDYIAYDE